MSNEFEPYQNDVKTGEFSAWEFHVAKDEEQPEITVEEVLIDECALLKQQAIEEGYAEGMQLAQEEIRAQKAELSKWIDLLQKPVQLLDDKLTQEIIQTMTWLCTHCIGVELSVNPNQLLYLLDEIKKELPSLKANKHFGMHPDDVEWIKSELNEKDIPGLHDLLVADPSLSRGDFYLKDEHSELDGRIQTRFITLFAKYVNKDNLVTPIKSQDLADD